MEAFDVFINDIYCVTVNATDVSHAMKLAESTREYVGAFILEFDKGKFVRTHAKKAVVREGETRA